MTREEFIEVLKEKGYSYKIEGDKIVVTHRYYYVDLGSLKSLPPGVEFKNGKSVGLASLTSLPPGVEFKNGGDVYLGSLIGWFSGWSGNIEGIDSKRLLNFMISKGVFI